ncbi:CAAX protease [Pseudomonas syringae ICMP 11293]|uniref:CPBP family intramembrane glutamic endopeptidase n=1 Tax=Pseudomonas syringae TaxID=317 RepID=UPI0007315FC0|nr:CPBP family intramembrane glutamic endopeptidase [Pseudomonas syringae]KTB89391.1 CAAX protease [Pseudomonas syringae ICMP 11293]MCK9743514.1 CPBP family intramembrane metalloprotease [Pseudomonas syringae pv. syringae]MCK9769068.1 CPBP family intramembrane metalloprotease [Pseudomonas syringae pv. syringae]PBP91292.1 CPBP family intramembrane metalloprotease [Pseudomonas syringae]QNR43094.1 CPBP family intramembrane metalloprotease [Pseudomonas syringae]
MTTRHWLTFCLLSSGYALALFHGNLDPSAALSFGALFIAWFCVTRSSYSSIRLCGHGLFIVTGLALAFHLAPGFNNANVIEATRFSADAALFSMDLNLDKPLIGFWLILACPWILPKVDVAHSLQTGLLALIVTSAFCMTAAVMLNVVGWTPKWPAQGLIWLLNNLLLVTLTEELFFRAYLQGSLMRLFKSSRYATALSITLAAGLFGLAHAGAGPQWVALAGMAGVGYGIAFRFGGLQAAVISHLGLNLVHFGLFTYPMLARQG